MELGALTEVERRFITAQIEVENLQRQVDLRKFDLLRTVRADAVLRPLVFDNSMGAPVVLGWDHRLSR
jgi:hypothetical protein